MTEKDHSKLIEIIQSITSKGNKAEIEQGRDGLKVLEVKKRKVWEEKNNTSYQ